MKLSVSELINAQPALAFAMVADVKAWPSMISAINKVEVLTRDPVGAGTRFLETRRVFGTRNTENMTISEFEPPSRFVLTAFSHGMRYRARHEFKPNGIGTELTLTFSGRPITRAAHVLTPFAYLFAPVLRRQLLSDLRDLKRAIELRASSIG